MISGVVITCNRDDVLEWSLRSVRFVDELIVVDKSPSGSASQIALRYADKYVKIPWTPTVEESRAGAVEACSHEVVIALDDDECLSPAAAQFIREEAAAPRADIYSIPFRHYILGRHDERAYYWPEYRSAFFRRGAVEFTSTVHRGVHLKSDSRYILPLDGEVCIHHLSHPNVASWIEKTNRYTSYPCRGRSFSDDELTSVGSFARRKLDDWLSRVKHRDNYLEAVATLRGIYDIVDGLKRWEELQSRGEQPFAAIKSSLDGALNAAAPHVADRSYTSDWFSHHIPTWVSICSSTGLSHNVPVTAVELGSFEGRSANWMLDNILGHSQSVLHCVDTFADHANSSSYWNRFRRNVLWRDDAAKVRAHIGSTTSFLLNFLQKGEAADFIYVDASHRAPDVLSDLILAFKCLKVGGVAICDDYLGGSAPDDPDLTLGSPKIAIDTFVTIFRPQIEIIAGVPINQVAFVKRRESLDDDPASRGESSRSP